MRHDDNPLVILATLISFSLFTCFGQDKKVREGGRQTLNVGGNAIPE